MFDVLDGLGDREVLGELLEFVGAPRLEDCTRCEARRSGDGEGALLVETFFLVGQGSHTLVWVLQRGLGGSVNSSIPREKIRLSCVSHLHSSIVIISSLLACLIA